ncbi:hypothetical protein CKAH01_04913 [Colletotrichum kahawae]|uniref:NWD NACHT-NTPase N-terminal domain-containing protein n=1 Tax=Colletotrichum kahawae TaxID=34407 RepID=A0AAD9YJQ1_COLKA|nr:hypothetical protein CKAH01_04913 [Colletotrichum kahawae]
MARERKRDAWRRRLLGSKDRPAAASSQADDSNSVSSTSELAPAVLSPLRANTPDPAPSEQVETLDTQQQEPETPNDVWAAAFRNFQESDGDLAKDYAKLLNPAREDYATKFDIDFVESTVKRLDQERDEKQWKVAFAGKSIHIRSQVEKMVKFLIWTDTVVKPALSTQPYAALAWSAVSIFLPLVKAGTELHDSLLAGLEEINRMLVSWKISESTVYPFRSHARRSFYNIFIDLHRHIIRYYAHAVCHLSSTQLSRARENLVGWNGWEAETKSISELNQNCQSYLEAAQRKAFQETMEMKLVEIHNSRLALKNISRSLEEIQFHYEDQLEGRLLESLHAEFKGHKNANPERVKGTCKWVLQDPKFHQWRDSKSSSLLWISARPGYGKSVLSRALIDSKLLKSPARAATSSVCYFFFKDGDEKRTRACDAIAAILHQLFAQDLTGNLIKKAKAAYHSAGAGLRDSFDELWDIFVSCITSPDAGEILCLLDALDECEQLERDRLVTCLNKFYNTYEHDSASTSSLKFIITSRPWKVIQLSLQGLFEPEHPSQSSHINGDDRLHEISEEIELVIEENLPAITGHLSQNDQEEIGEHLKAMENRTYLWLRLVFQMVKQNPTEYTRKSDIIHLFESLPAEVSQVYEKVLRCSYNDPKTQLLFQLMLAAPRPLLVKEADEALTFLTSRTSQWESKTDFDNDCWGKDFASIVQNWTGFLVVSTTTSSLWGKEQTVREFLLGPKPAPGSWKGRFSYPETQTAMLSACLERLSPGYINEEGQNWWYHTRFLGYAAQYWPVHYELQEHDEKEEASGKARLLCDIMQPNTAAWLAHNSAWEHWVYENGLSTENFDILSIAAFFGLTHLVEKIRQNDAVDSSQVRGNMVAPLQAAS